ncbi:MAG: hypothetical protein LBU92_04105 [Prevotellaceae bacterium]|jgi:C-terminal peptidase prc|nr:hypothetical protein [Prevotellaceae bacterium]
MFSRKLFVAAAALLLFSACSDDADSEKTLPYEELMEEELAYNHFLLKTHYLHKEEKLKNYEHYSNIPAEGDFGKVIAMYDSMGDQYTQYFTPDEAQEVLALLTSSGDGGAISGFEMEENESGDTTVVTLAYSGYAAHDAGMRKNDRIVEVNGVNVTGPNTLNRTYDLLGGTRTEIKVIDAQGVEKNLVITKRKGTPPTVFLDSVGSIPVIQITEFTGKTSHPEGTKEEFREALAKIQGAKAGVIDLRGNPGGEMEHVLDMADQIIAAGEIIRYVDHYYDSDVDQARVDTVKVQATQGGLGENTKWVFLADEESASSSEVMLFAAKNNLNSSFVGTTTYGKGVGQYYINTYAGGLAGITALKFFDQNWYTYNEIGIVPDEEIANDAAALARAVALSEQALGLRRRSAAASAKEAAKLSRRIALRRVDTQKRMGGAWKMK